MANRPIKDTTYKGVIIDTAPGASGYWCEPVSGADHKVGQFNLYMSGIWAGTVTLQFRPKGDPGWKGYDDFTNTDDPVQIIEDYTDCEWRAGVASGNYISGTVRIRLGYHDGENR